MRFIRGNLTLREHIKEGRRVFLFTGAERSFVKFETELELFDVDYFVGKDKEGEKRTAIKFFFKRAGKHLNYDSDQIPPSSVEEPSESAQSDIPNKTERKGLVTSRVGQGAYRKSILHRWAFKCAVTSYSKIDILIASHIVAWKGSTDEERLDVNNGILLSPVYDALFDQHLISFENNGKIIISNALAKTRYLQIGVSGKESIKNISADNHPYLERHRSILIL